VHIDQSGLDKHQQQQNSIVIKNNRS